MTGIRSTFQHGDEALDQPLLRTTPEQRQAARRAVIAGNPAEDVSTVLQALGLAPYDGPLT